MKKEAILSKMLGGILLFSLPGCQNELYKDAAEDFQSEQGVFVVETAPVITYVEEFEAKRIENVQLGLVKKVEESVSATLEVKGQDFLDNYNKKNGTDYVLLPSEMYEMETAVSFAPKETRTVIPVNIKDNLAFSSHGTYAIPISIGSSSVDVVPGGKDVLLVLEPINYKKVFKLNRSGGDIEDTQMFPEDFKLDQWTIEAMVMHSSYTSNNVSVCGTRTRSADTMDEIYPRFGDVTIKPHQFQLKTASTQIDVPESKFKAEPDKWYMMSLVYDGVKNYIYMNGVLVAEETLRSGPYGAVGFWIGGNNEWIREVRFWKVARTKDQINATLWKSVNPNDENLLLYYPLDGTKYDHATGEVIEDETMIWDWSKNAKHLSISGASVSFDDNGGEGFRFPPVGVVD